MKIKLIDLNEKLIESWKKTFSNVKEVEVIHGSIFDHPSDAIVSPANSFGFMNGGIDFSISKNLGWHLEKKLQKIIREKHYGELLVGQAEIIETNHNLFPYLISAPTMRNPMTLSRTPNVYLAMRAILLLQMHKKFDNGTLISDKVNTIAIPGLGTGVGQVPPIVCAKQMRIAWEDVIHQKHNTIELWEEMRSNYAYFQTNDDTYLKYKF